MKTILLACLLTMSCGTSAWKTTTTLGTNCALPEIEKVVGSIFSDVIAALASSNYGPLLSQIIDTLKGQGVTDAIGIVTCAVQSAGRNAPGERATNHDAVVLIHANAKAWLARTK